MSFNHRGFPWWKSQDPFPRNSLQNHFLVILKNFGKHFYLPKKLFFARETENYRKKWKKKDLFLKVVWNDASMIVHRFFFLGVEC